MADTMNADARGSKKVAKCERQFIDADGGVHARAFEGVAAVRLHFVESGNDLLMPLNELPDGIIRAAAAFGLNTSVGNTFGAIEDPDEALEIAAARWETLKSGQWTSDRVTGPRIGDLIEAMCRLREEKGKPADDAYRAAITESLSDPAQAKAVGGDPRIQLHVAAIRKERAESRLRERVAKGNLGGAAADGLLDL